LEDSMENCAEDHHIEHPEGLTPNRRHDES
jgi:hypothetical protein